MKRVIAADIHGNHDARQDYDEVCRCRSRATSRIASLPSCGRVPSAA